MAQITTPPRHHVRTLLWKNALLKRRQPLRLLFEVFFPVAFIVVLGILKRQAADIDVPAGWSDNMESTFASTKSTAPTYSLYDGYPANGSKPPKFAATEATMTGLLLRMSLMSYAEGRRLNELSPSDQHQCMEQLLFLGAVSLTPTSPHAVPPACQGKVVPYKLAIVPDTAYTREYFAAAVGAWYPRLPLTANSSGLTVPSFLDAVVFYPDEATLESYISGGTYGQDLAHPKIFGAIVFEKTPRAGSVGSIAYALRLNTTSDDVPSTNGATVNRRQKALVATDYVAYARKGFQTLQTLVTRFAACVPSWDGQTPGNCTVGGSAAAASDALDARLLTQVVNDDTLVRAVAAYNTAVGAAVNLGALPPATMALLLPPLRQAPQAYYGGLVLPYPIAAYTASPFFATAGGYFAFVFVVSYVQLVTGIVVALVKEKETKAREMMKVLGVADGAIFASWYLTYGAIVAVAAGLQTLAASQMLFPHAAAGVLYIFFGLFGLAVVAFGFFVSTFFSRPRTAAFVAIVAFLLLFLISEAFSTTASTGAKAWGCLAPPIAMAFGIATLADSEVTSTGVSFATVGAEINGFALRTSLIMLAVDVVLFTLLGMYFEKVVPKDYGVPEPWHFPVSRFWRRPATGLALLADTDPNAYATVEAVGVDLQAQEASGDALQIQRLRKTFVGDDGVEKVAVAGLSLTLYKDQITCLLGHNGAGKTTLISMLTGMLPATAGDATLLRGLSLRRDMQTIRQSIGMCPQHDVLYDDLTVLEHLHFYGRIKGVVAGDIDAKIADVGLTEKRHARAKELSGGMKRKLSLAIAFLGDSQIVFLDEPTSGMDPYSRRASWETMLNHRQGRIIVLTTHSMDEADILGDRIAILAGGSLRCAGSALFLKSKFGAGYNLALVTAPDANLGALSTVVATAVPQAKVISNVGTEVVFQLPLDASPVFPALFATLDTDAARLGVVSYGISVTTLEEVFLTVAEQAADDDGDDGGSVPSAAAATPTFKVLDQPPLPPLARFLSHFRALWRKRFLNAKRDRKIVVFATLWPAVYIAIGMIILKTSATTKDAPSLELSTAQLPLGTATPMPFTCTADSWCTGIADGLVDATVESVPLRRWPTPTPTVFGISYTVNATDTTGLCLGMAQTSYELGVGNVTLASRDARFGSAVVFASAADRVVGYNLLVNTTARHAAPVYKALLDAAVVRTVTGNAAAAPTVRSHPLPLTQASRLLSTTILSFTATSFIVVAIAYFSASIVPFLVQERHERTNAKHLQLVSGVSLPAFWAANLAWDVLLYLCPASLALVAIQAFGISPYTGVDCSACAANPFAAVVVLFVLCGVAVVGFCYVVSFLCKEPAEAQSYIVSCNIYLGVYLLLVSTILSLIPSTQSVNDVLVFIFRVSPLFALGDGLYSLSVSAIRNQFTGDAGDSAFATTNAGYDVLYLALEAVAYPLAAVAIDYMLSFPSVRARWTKVPRAADEAAYIVDHDVDAEAARVLGGDSTDIVALRALRKVYPGGKVAVAGLSLGLEQGDCFGFLGINGAGKTTTMKMLTGDVLPTMGSATLGGLDILRQQLAVRRLVGYCPQFDALFDLLSVREHLELYAALKGVPAVRVPEVVDEKLTQLSLVPYATKLAKTLSGGNKRKLSVAIALIGAPPLLFLDEPTTGMDPVSRRYLWNVIANLSTRSKEATIFLTTHSMEECEALCNRVGIMVGGRLRCLGSIQHLKSRFGEGLLLHIKLAPVTADDVDDLADSGAAPVGRHELAALCVEWGRPERVHLVRHDHPTGYALADALDKLDSVPRRDLASWWRREDQYDACLAGLHEAFGADAVTIVERHLDVLRVKITDAASLGGVFAAIEERKARLRIQEYTVSQTTLEQIFNGFASTQTQETGVARGVQVARTVA
ncbi:ATP-binding Cassette (ABC) Superfamily [Achlya hypogyna]|uniref:ATP-binding Cassette (ABC) Superfamily n=1 Tax=Achlya hypogyna TaxID=1202772 RepID=A0A1V9Z0Z1_ACHHY|nr:ATP-binding Cassette (ABC) Superfamily [Achlya hypogyna]